MKKKIIHLPRQWKQNDSKNDEWRLWLIDQANIIIIIIHKDRHTHTTTHYNYLPQSTSDVFVICFFLISHSISIAHTTYIHIIDTFLNFFDYKFVFFLYIKYPERERKKERPKHQIQEQNEEKKTKKKWVYLLSFSYYYYYYYDYCHQIKSINNITIVIIMIIIIIIICVLFTKY